MRWFMVSIDWIASDDAEGLLAEGRLHDLDGIVIPGGFGVRGIEGKIAAAGYARENEVPSFWWATASTLARATPPVT